MSCELSQLVSHRKVTHSQKHFIYLIGEYLSYLLNEQEDLVLVERKHKKVKKK